MEFKSCRSGKILQIGALIVKIGVDTDEYDNDDDEYEPRKVKRENDVRRFSQNL